MSEMDERTGTESFSLGFIILIRAVIVKNAKLFFYMIAIYNHSDEKRLKHMIFN